MASRESTTSGSSTAGRGRPGDSGGEQEHREVAGEDHQGREQDAGPHAGCEQSPARLGQRGGLAASARDAAPPVQQNGRHSHRRAHHRHHRRGAGRREELADPCPGRGRRDEQHRASDGEQGDLARDPLQDDRADTSPDVAFRTAVSYRAVDVAQHTAGQRRVQEQGAVVVGDGPAERQPQAEPAGHQAPAPGAAHRGQQAEGEGGGQGGRVDPAYTGQEGAGSQVPQQHSEDRHASEDPEPRPVGPAHQPVPVTGRGSASRSVWCTVTLNSPAAQAARRRRR